MSSIHRWRQLAEDLAELKARSRFTPQAGQAGEAEGVELVPQVPDQIDVIRIGELAVRQLMHGGPGPLPLVDVDDAGGL